jgi:CRISPR-associated protein Csd2
MAIENRYEFVMLFDVENGNPNGDPDAGNMPRVDPETGFGLVTDVCIKRKIRNYVSLVKQNAPGFKIYVRDGAVLNDEHEWAYKECKIKMVNNSQNNDSKKKQPKEDVVKARAFMCENYYDIRTFGAVMSTGDAVCGQVRGPVQLNFARSIDPIAARELSITRCAVTKKEDELKERTMGKKHIVPYALYRVEGYISANLAQKKEGSGYDGTGFDEEDLNLLWDALINLFEDDHSAARGKMATRKLFVFKHDSIFGCSPSHLLFDRISVKKTVDGPARSFADYSVKSDCAQLPAGVTCIEKL